MKLSYAIFIFLVLLTGCNNIKNWKDVENKNRHFSHKVEYEFINSNWESYLTNIHYGNSSLDVYQKDIAKQFMDMQLGGISACNYYQYQLDKIKKDKKKLKIFEKTKKFTLELDKKFKKTFGKATLFRSYYSTNKS